MNNQPIRERFEKLINCLHEKTEHTDIENKFKEIACFLMNEVCIKAGGRRYRIIVCEIYYNDGENHKDPYLYGAGNSAAANESAKYQKKMLHWFFHYSGIDLTIGNGGKIMGGILIRAVQEVIEVDNRPILGPLKSSLEMLNNIHGEAFNNEANEGGNCHFYLGSLPPEMTGKKEINTSIRIGLDKERIKKELDSKVEKPFYMREYQYLTQA